MVTRVDRDGFAAKAALAAKRAKADRRVQTDRKRAKGLMVLMGCTFPETDTVGQLVQMVQRREAARDGAIRTLYATMDNTDNAPITVYNSLKGTFGTRLPNFADWLKSA